MALRLRGTLSNTQVVPPTPPRTPEDHPSPNKKPRIDPPHGPISLDFSRGVGDHTGSPRCHYNFVKQLPVVLLNLFRQP